jgi:hypothetical protein
MELGKIVDEGRYRQDFAIADEVAMDGDISPKSTKQGEFLSDRIHITNLGDIVHEGRYRRHLSLCSEDIGLTLVLPKSTKQGGFFCQPAYILQNITMYLPLDQFIHADFGKIVCDGGYGRISSLSTTILLFFLLFGVRCRSTRVYECFSTGCYVSYIHTLFI